MSEKTYANIAVFLGGSLYIASLYYLGLDHILGWWFAIATCVCYLVYFWFVDLKVFAAVEAGSIIGSAYGLYKWTQGVGDFTMFDFLILLVTFLFMLYVANSLNKKAKEDPESEDVRFWKWEVLGASSFLIGTLTLGIFHSWWPWVLFITAYGVLGFIQFVRKEWLPFVFQVTFVYFALVTLNLLPAPF